MANVDFPEPRSPTNANEASEVKPGILPLVGVRGGVGVLDVTADSEFELMKAYGRSRPSTLSGPSLLIMAANDLFTPAMMPHSACMISNVWWCGRVSCNANGISESVKQGARYHYSKLWCGAGDKDLPGNLSPPTRGF